MSLDRAVRTNPAIADIPNVETRLTFVLSRASRATRSSMSNRICPARSRRPTACCRETAARTDGKSTDARGGFSQNRTEAGRKALER